MDNSEHEHVYRLADSVLHRIVQIVQEGVLTGIDVSDLMRQIRLVEEPLVDTANTLESVLVLSPQYVEQVERAYDAMCEFAADHAETSRTDAN